jgi:hypothetical protein
MAQEQPRRVIVGIVIARLLRLVVGEGADAVGFAKTEALEGLASRTEKRDGPMVNRRGKLLIYSIEFTS